MNGTNNDKLEVHIFLLRTEILAEDCCQAFQLNETETLMW